MKRLKKSRYITGFDGIRSIAVIAVILYHLFPYTMKGGLMGVPIFFVVSGYLITDLLIQEWEQNGKIDIIGFYIRRMKRLYPALITMLMVTGTYITLFQRNLLTNLGKIIVSNIFYVYNWFEIRMGQSYFDKFATQSPFTHLWSLSIEGQFYLLWPFVILGLLKLVHKNSHRFWIIFAVSLLSAIEMALLFSPGKDPSRLYYGTDTRMFSILIGTSLAFVWPSTKLRAEMPAENRRIINLVGYLSMVILLIFFVTLSGENPFVYHFGMYLFSLVSAVLVAVVAHPGASLNRLFTNPFFSYIGKRSYGIYIYQFPVLTFYEAKINIGEHPILNGIVEILIILIISELSYRLIEQPLKKFDYTNALEEIKDVFMAPKGVPIKKKVSVILALTTVAITLVGSFQSTTVKKASSSDLEKQIIKNNKEVAKKNKQINHKDESNSASSSSSVKEDNINDENLKLSPKQVEQANNLAITAVGDSVLADGSAELQKIFPKMYVDAKVGRQTADAVQILQNSANSNQLADTILVVEGTNGPFVGNEVSDIMKIAGKKRQVYWVNTHVPTRRWEGQVNKDLQKNDKKYKNLHIVDWNSYCKNHPDWFYDDNVHPNPEGVKYYSHLVAKNILK
ncbi:acyltransferase family protein [Ligilactobacillus hayakitensis]|nr:acyltransferase family protein [Ligilactobacillus hayakitensis]